ncbi:hypothetical protein [Methanoregula sp.]|uniref:hypothetical protein n=1 Tax=Methanoregula sp. TaxID=2052170 RepID=UPI003C73DD5B
MAEHMGYHWTDNTDPSIRFDGLMYRPARMVAVKLKKIRYDPGGDWFAEDKFPDDVADLRDLPLPSAVIRELWVRTQNERAYRRFIILPGTTVEIEANTAENYRNTHFREEYWKKAPYSYTIPLRRRGENS